MPDLDPDAWTAWLPWWPPARVDAAPVSDIMTALEVAHYLKMTRITLYRVLPSSDIPHVRIGRLYRFSRRAIEAWLRGHAPPAG